MPYRIEKLYKDNYYHIYNRGVNHSTIFFEKRNYMFFIDRLHETTKNIAETICYCLMPNHFHIVLFICDESKIERSLTRLFISYSKAINKSMARSGPLFDGRFKSKLIPENNYLLHLSRYIHLNPVRANMVTKAEDWLYSSYQLYISNFQSSFVKKEIILDQVRDYREFVESFQENQKYFIKKLLFN